MLATHASVLLLLLPLAMASCPCPTTSASAEVCGSNYVTYDSQCALDCAGLPGLKLLHLGPCSSMQSILGTVFNVSLPSSGSFSPRSSVRSAVGDLTKEELCMSNRCAPTSLNCGCLITDASCFAKCALNCTCYYCVGIPPGPADLSTVNKCVKDKQCEDRRVSCENGCGTAECRAQCRLDRHKCGCECNGSLSLRLTPGLGVALLAVWVVSALTVAKL